MMPVDVKQLCAAHKIRWRTFDTYYNLLYVLSVFDPDLCGLHLERENDFNIQGIT